MSFHTVTLPEVIFRSSGLCSHNLREGIFGDFANSIQIGGGQAAVSIHEKAGGTIPVPPAPFRDFTSRAAHTESGNQPKGE